MGGKLGILPQHANMTLGEAWKTYSGGVMKDVKGILDPWKTKLTEIDLSKIPEKMKDYVPPSTDPVGGPGVGGLKDVRPPAPISTTDVVPTTTETSLLGGFDQTPQKTALVTTPPVITDPSIDLRPEETWYDQAKDLFSPVPGQVVTSTATQGIMTAIVGSPPPPPEYTPSPKGGIPYYMDTPRMSLSSPVAQETLGWEYYGPRGSTTDSTGSYGFSVWDENFKRAMRVS